MTKRYNKSKGTKRKIRSGEASKQNNSKSQFTIFLWIFIIGVSGYLFYQSPSLIEGINSKEKNNIKKEKIRKLLNQLKDSDDSVVINKKQIVDPIISEDRSFVSIYFCKVFDQYAKIIPFKISLIPEEDKITQILEKLIVPPVNLNKEYQSLIPSNTKLLGHYLKGNLLTINLNDHFLNNYSGEVGKKLKIAQIVFTLTSLSNVDKVVFEINGKHVKYLDRDGIIENRPLGSNDVEYKIALE